MNERQFGDKVAQLLNQGTPLEARQADRLRAARELALARQKPEPARAFAWAYQLATAAGGWRGISLRLVAPLAALALGLTAIYSWQQNQRISEVEEIDAQLLTDDLPIDAYLDRGFQNWLKKRAAGE